ncbi:MAG TPA: coagulation factor 5/8 type domain-containing protein, partial [Thermoanaerobaculia bacterium]|nr:coagulation factor 5/8 type domain-containing protein [Thermoanaerobaculia bacterium]
MSASNQSIRLIDAPSGLASFSLGALLFVLIAGSAEAQQIGILDDFSNPASWEPVASEGIALKVAPDDGFSGRSIRLDIDYQEHGGYVIVRRAVDLTLPENYEFTFRIRGDLPRNNLEFKLVDGSDDNVWWLNQRNFEFTEDWRLVRIRKRHITFAWGPQGGGDPGTIAAIEFAISVGTGGRGSVWIDELTFGEREPERPYDLTPTANASVNSASARAILDSDPATAWQTSARTAVVSLDFLRERE